MLSLLSQYVSRLLAPYSHKAAVVAALILAYVACIVSQTVQTIVSDGDNYRRLVARLQVDSVAIPQLRGFIFAQGGEMLAGSLPQYDLYLDFRSTTVPNRINGKLNIPADTVRRYFQDGGPGAQVLARLDPSKSAAQHGRDVLKAYSERRPRYPILTKVSYMDYHHYLRLPSTPYFGKQRYSNGLLTVERAYRLRPYGDRRMASSTIGSVTGLVDSTGRIHGTGGLELALDSVLSGQTGLGFSQDIRGRRKVLTIQKPVNGHNVHTTLDIEMQQILDQALGKRLLELHAEAGWAAIMEVKTGKIRAIANLRRTDNIVVEDHNHLCEDLADPGSTFKTVTYMVMLDDGKVTPETIVDTENTSAHPQHFHYKSQRIRDDHPVGRVTADEAIVQSSNIAIAKLAIAAYEKDQQAFLDGIERIGLLNDRPLSDADRADIKRLGYLSHLELSREFPGARAARHRQTTGPTWSATSLAQVSYGYETQIPGIYLLQFYNAIANDGRMVRPYIVDYIDDEHGNVTWRQKPTVINRQICKPSTLRAVRHALEGVVDHGTAAGKAGLPGAKSSKVAIAGKTGTAQRYNPSTKTYSGYGHNVSFAGYFPADHPQYSGIVVIHAIKGNFGSPGGGYMAGPVFRDFAEQVYALRGERDLSQLKPDSLHPLQPLIKRGPARPLEYLCGKLGLDKGSAGDRHATPDRPADLSTVPNVVGMGASDALYHLESVGLRVTLSGVGTVSSQSLPPGSPVTRGATIGLKLK